LLAEQQQRQQDKNQEEYKQNGATMHAKPFLSTVYAMLSSTVSYFQTLLGQIAGPSCVLGPEVELLPIPGIRFRTNRAGGELEQIQFLLGHVSVETTERYLGCKQRLRSAVNDHIGLEP
jgi:hypothetical protein